MGGDRRSVAADRIYSAAVELMAQSGYDAFTIDALAAKVHCSPATIYRHAGGKTAIRDAVMSRQADAVLESVREAIAGLTGAERVVTATTIALKQLRADPLAKIMRSMTSLPGEEWLTKSTVVTRLADEMVGRTTPDPVASQWLIRTFLALCCWPPADADTEEHMVRRFLGPPYDARADGSA